MRVLGVDPGTITLGYAVVDGGTEQMRMVDCGVINLPRKAPAEERLRLLYIELTEIIDKHKPTEVAIEEPFVGQNIKSAFALGKAEAIAILAATNQSLPVYYYSPATVKQQITNYGRSDKQQLGEMLRTYLGLPNLEEAPDAADALAVAICHLWQSQCSHWLNKRVPR